MTSLIDVIFLLLLFFMLTSTFSKFSEVELVAGGSGQGAAVVDTAPVFLRLGEEVLSLDGDVLGLSALEPVLTAKAAPEQPVLVSLQVGVTAQRLTDVLVVLRAMPGLRVTVLGGA